jgi:hypothetical protein
MKNKNKHRGRKQKKKSENEVSTHTANSKKRRPKRNTKAINVYPFAATPFSMESTYSFFVCLSVQLETFQ